MKVRLRDIINGIKENAITYIVQYTGPNHKERRIEAAENRRAYGGPKRVKPQNWDRDRRKRRKEQKRRRKQRWQG
jgi:hypothetical protein